MPTKLKKPITITFTHVENAICALFNSMAEFKGTSSHPNYNTIWPNKVRSEFCNQLRDGLKAQGIDWNTWLPEPPLTIGGHEVVFNADGTAKIGCTTVTYEQAREVMNRWPVKQAEPEWPKYFFESVHENLFRCYSESDPGMMWGKTFRKWGDTDNQPMLEWANRHNHKQLTRAEAAAIVGESNL